MIKSVAYFPLQCAKNSSAVMSAMLDALRVAGIVTEENSWNSDAVIIWSVLWSGRMAANRAVYDRYRSQGRPVIVIDVGALCRERTWKIAVNNITADGYYGHTENLQWDRPCKLGISLAFNLSTDPRIVIAAQHARSLQVADIQSQEAWIMQQVRQLRAITDRPIVIRPHPRCALNRTKLAQDITIEHPVKITNTYDSYNLAFACHAMVNYNSGPGIQAALAGTRPVVGRSSLAYPVGVQMQNIDRPYEADRDQWLVEICHTEYTQDEILQGVWLGRLEAQLG